MKYKVTVRNGQRVVGQFVFGTLWRAMKFAADLNHIEEVLGSRPGTYAVSIVAA